MAAVAFVTEFGNSVNPTNVISSLASPALVKSTCMMNLMHVEGLPERTMTKLHAKKGSLTAAALAEATARAMDANGELTDSSVTSTIAKTAVTSALSVEQLQFGNITPERVADEQAAGIARAVDTDALSLFSGLSATVTSANVLTIADLMAGQFNIYNSECPDKQVTLQAVLTHRGHMNIKSEMIQAGASVWTNQTFLDILGRNPQANCYVGSIPGLADVYATSGHATSGGDSVQAIFHPMWCFAGNFAPAPQFVITDVGSGGLYKEIVGYFFYDVLEWNDLCGVGLLSDT